MKIDKRISQQENSLENFDKKCDNLDYIKTLEEILQYYLSQRVLKKSLHYAKMLLNYHKDANRVSQYCTTLNLLGKIYSLTPDMDKADFYFSEALRESRRYNDKKQEAFSLTNLGLLLRKQDKLDKSLESYFQAKELMEELLHDKSCVEDKKIQSYYLQALDQIGVIYNILKQPKDALKYMQLSLEKAVDAKVNVSIYTALINLGVFYSETDSKKSLSYYLEALPYVERDNNSQILAVVLNNIGGVYEDTNNYKRALEYYLRALEILKSFEQGEYELYITRHISNVYYKQRNLKKALEYVNISLSLAQKDNHVAEIEENFKLLSKIYEEKEEFQKALEFSRKYISLKEESINKKMQQRVEILQDKFEKTQSKLIESEQKGSLLSKALQKKMQHSFIGVSPAIRKIHATAIKAAQTPHSNILITGESGTGKEVIANMIHFASDRNNNMMVSVNSGSIPDGLIESAFWGHKKGAFTGAVSDQPGYLKLADGGTLFLDEIGDMPMNLQIKLLRVLENKKFLPLGANKEVVSDFRLITATNKDIESLINNSKFRVDLFYRINTIEIHIPPLRERKEDIIPITKHYLNHYAKELQKERPNLDNEVVSFLQNYSFPGNVRELKNMIERVMITLNNDTLYAEDFCPKVSTLALPKETPSQITTLAEMEEDLIRKTLEKTEFNISQTARILGIHYTTLNRKLKSLNINKEYK